MHVAKERRESEAFADLRVSERKIYKRERESLQVSWVV